MAYRAPGAPNLHPADAALKLPEETHSHGLRKLAALESARGSFGDAAHAITRITAVMTGKRQVEELARRAAADIDAFCTGRRPGQRPDDALLVLTFDGKGDRHAARGASPSHRQGGRNSPAPAGHPPVSWGKARPQAAGRTGRRL